MNEVFNCMIFETFVTFRFKESLKHILKVLGYIDVDEEEHSDEEWHAEYDEHESESFEQIAHVQQKF